MIAPSSSSSSALIPLREKSKLLTLTNKRYDFYRLIVQVLWFRTLITARVCLNSFHFRLSLLFPRSSIFLGFLRVWGFSGFAELRHHPFLSLCFLLSFSCFLAFFEMARTKTTSNPSPKVHYRALYPWASEDLLAETSTLTSSKDVMKHREDEVAHMLW